jgi:hypothetical protein
MTDLALAGPVEPCDCCTDRDGWQRLVCVCECHAGLPLTLALLHRTWTQLRGTSHVRAATDLRVPWPDCDACGGTGVERGELCPQCM